MTIILGGGLAGLSASYHLNHQCRIFEKYDHCGGHIFSQKINGFVWDEGPHISFTKYAYVKKLFEESCEYLEYPVFPTNYYKGHWVDHPAQTNLFALPEPIRTQCLDAFLSSRENIKEGHTPADYREWLHMAFGETFAEEFPAVYTRKYWTTPPENLTTDWVGERVYYPAVEDVKSGYEAPLKVTKHYQSLVRYPRKGGYFSYAAKLKENADISYNKTAQHIDLKKRTVSFSDGTTEKYEKLVNTIPLPEFIAMTDAPGEIQHAAKALSCTEVLLVNVVIAHPAPRKNQWIYVYDSDKYATRLSYTDLFSPENGVKGQSGIQVEVYFSKYRPQTEKLSEIVSKVCDELVEMGLARDHASILEINTSRVKYANVIFDHPRKAALEKIFNYLGQFGLAREDDDLAPMTEWNKKLETNKKLGDLIMAGRFGEWKYHWTDDCVMRGLQIGRDCLN